MSALDVRFFSRGLTPIGSCHVLVVQGGSLVADEVDAAPAIACGPVLPIGPFESFELDLLLVGFIFG